MHFYTTLALLTALVGVNTAPAKELEARSGGVECSKHDGKWKYGWEGAKPSEQYICATGGLLVNVLRPKTCNVHETDVLPYNILNCVSVLNRNTVSIPISLLNF